MLETLFDAPEPDDERPLAVRARPATLAGFVGQEHLLAPGSALRTAVETGRAHSMILHGPPGSGKTTLARMIGAAGDGAFEELSAVNAGRAEVRAVIERARLRRRASGEATILFLDEIHRFNKAQQDALLPAVEEEEIVLIGATTENPAFEVNSALLSRTRVYALRALDEEQVERVLAGLPERLGVTVDDGVLAQLARGAHGDARVAIAALELAAQAAAAAGERTIGPERAADAMQQRAVRYDRAGDRHYDYISAWIKSVRGSDPDAALYYLAVMLEGGEDPAFVARRAVILASEDIGNADPGALTLATAAAAAVERVGPPEASFALAQATVYLALAPKSNAAGHALAAARSHVREHGAAPPPAALQSGPRPGADRADYEYPHDLPGALSPQELAPAEVAGRRFFTPTEREEDLARRLERIRHLRGRP